jgi:hypothetical protein
MIEDLLPCAILLPSLDRPQYLKRVTMNIHLATPEAHFILFCVSDPESKRVLDDIGEWYLDDSDCDDRRYVTRMNKLLSYIEDAKTVFFGSDDVIHHDGWLGYALLEMDKGFDVVVVNDLHNMSGTQAVVRRSYLDRAVYDSPGKAFHPGYQHNFADNEMFYTANVRGVLSHSRESVVEHLHPLFGALNSLPWDETYRGAQLGWDKDAALWRERRQRIEQLGARP